MRQAEHLFNLAVEKSPGPATRYLFARGLLQLKREQYDAVRETAQTILKGALPPENPDRAEEKAAAYLRGLAFLSEKDPGKAVDEISRSVALSGYEYTNYHIGLAQAYLAAGRLEEALAAANKAAAALDPADPRLDLELDRIRARLLKARVEEAMGRSTQASADARSFLSAWNKADKGLPELAEARRLAEAGQ
jgi:tetratricopeptide (TPR) repeat protein